MTDENKTLNATDESLQQGGSKGYPLVPAFFSIALAWLAGANTPPKIAEYLDKNKDFLTSVIEDYGSCPPLDAEQILYLLKMVRLPYIEEEFDDYNPQMPSSMAMRAHSDVQVFFDKEACCVILEFNAPSEHEKSNPLRSCKLFDVDGCTASSDDLDDVYLAKNLICHYADFCFKIDRPKVKKAAAAAFDKPKVPPAVAKIQMPLQDGSVKSLCVSALPVLAMNRSSIGDWKEHVRTILRAQITYATDGVVTKSDESFYTSSFLFEDPAVAQYALDAIKFHEPNPPLTRVYLHFGRDGLRAKNRNHDQNADELNMRVKRISDAVRAKLKKEKKLATPSRIQNLLSENPQEVFDHYADLLVQYRKAQSLFLRFTGLDMDPEDEEFDTEPEELEEIFDVDLEDEEEFDVDPEVEEEKDDDENNRI